MQDIGGLDIQKQEIREAVELPLTHHELYRQIGIDPPRGVLLYGKEIFMHSPAKHGVDEIARTPTSIIQYSQSFIYHSQSFTIRWCFTHSTVI